jgi:hypothetical protein
MTVPREKVHMRLLVEELQYRRLVLADRGVYRGRLADVFSSSLRDRSRASGSFLWSAMSRLPASNSGLSVVSYPPSYGAIFHAVPCQNRRTLSRRAELPSGPARWPEPPTR